MKFGVREICDVVFKAKSNVKIGDLSFVPGQPVLYIDTAKTSTIEGAATTVYAQGGKGNTRLLAWEGEKTLTFTVEDALLSPMGFAVLSGAGLFTHARAEKEKTIYVHATAKATMGTDGIIDLTDSLKDDEEISSKSPIFVATLTKGSIDGMLKNFTIEEVKDEDDKSWKRQLKCSDTISENKEVFVDFYIEKKSGVSEMTIDAGNFGGYYYVEASTLFKREADGYDMPAEIIIPNVKIQSNFTFSMASTGDPSTFTFTMDAFPGYTRFDRSKKVLCIMQIIDEEGVKAEGAVDSVGADALEDKNYAE